METFKTAYSKAKTWGDLDNAIKETLTPSKMISLRDSLRIVKISTGLDMRQDFFLGILESYIKYNNKDASE